MSLQNEQKIKIKNECKNLTYMCFQIIKELKIFHERKLKFYEMIDYKYKFYWFWWFKEKKINRKIKRYFKNNNLLTNQ